MPVLALLAAAGLAAAAPPAPSPAPPVNVPAQPALTEAITARDAELFALFFTGPCDVARFRDLLAPDVEFYHDKDGFNVHRAEDFVAIYAKNCASRGDPAAWRSRRALVPGTLQVDPVPGYGAIEAGEHVFYEQHGASGPETLAGRARFAQLWVLGRDGKWRLSRVLSFGHRPAAEAPPAAP